MPFFEIPFHKADLSFEYLPCDTGSFFSLNIDIKQLKTLPWKIWDYPSSFRTMYTQSRCCNLAGLITLNIFHGYKA